MEHANQIETEMYDLTQVLANPNKKFAVVFEFEPKQTWMGLNPYQFIGSGKFSGEIWQADNLNLKGQIIIPTKFVCSKCGANFEENLFIEVDEQIVYGESEEHFSYVGNTINFNEIVAQIVATNIPSQVLCNKNCLGLCPVCGVNLNEEQCNCDKKLRGNNPFASLMDKFN